MWFLFSVYLDTLNFNRNLKISNRPPDYLAVSGNHTVFSEYDLDLTGTGDSLLPVWEPEDKNDSNSCGRRK